MDKLSGYRIKKAFESYAKCEISLQKAAKTAGITYRDALDELKRRRIPFGYKNEDLNKDINWAMR